MRVQATQATAASSSLLPLANIDRVDFEHLIVIVDEPIMAIAGNKICNFIDVSFITWEGDHTAFNWLPLELHSIVIWNLHPSNALIDWHAKFPYLTDISYFCPDDVKFMHPATTSISILSHILSKRSYAKPEIVEQNKPPVTPALRAHGLVGEIADWITATAIRPQPQLALGAALAFVGMLKGHKYSTTTGLRTNLLIMNIGPTASGKEHPQWCIEKLIRVMKLSRHDISEPTAGISLLRSLLEANRIGLWSIDEIGRYLGHVNNKNSGGYQREIIDYVMKSFSKANGILKGKSYADKKKNPQVDIVQPHLCVIGASVKERIVENCTSTDAIDGFLNRWLLFESTTRPRSENQEFNQVIPERIIQGIQRILDNDPNREIVMSEDAEPVVKPVKYTPDALVIMQNYVDTVEDMINRAPYPLNALYSRSCEHASKVALTLCDNEFVREQDVKMAIDIVTQSNDLIATFNGMLANNEYERDYNKVLDIIKKYSTGKGNDGITRNALTAKTQWILGGKKRRDEIIETLLDNEDIKAVKEAQKITYYYIFK